VCSFSVFIAILISLVRFATRGSDDLSFSQVSGQQQHTTQLVEQNARMRERTGELRDIITMKDDAIKKLRRTVDDQTLLIQSLRFSTTTGGSFGGDRKGSIMSEISEYVCVPHTHTHTHTHTHAHTHTHTLSGM
jgi:hypothetical protein